MGFLGKKEYIEDMKRRREQPKGFFTNLVTIEDIRKVKPEMIYYGAFSVWWTHDPKHLGKLDNGIPCDPSGGVLLQATDAERFLKTAEQNPKHYGKHGLKAFIAAHHENMVVSRLDNRHICFKSWDECNRVLDQQEEEE